MQKLFKIYVANFCNIFLQNSADPNRNFPAYFGGSSTSPDPCNYQTYHGTHALSEPCTKALADYMQGLLSNGVNLKAYLSFHSVGPLWLLPWGHTVRSYPDDYADQVKKLKLNSLR